MAETKKRKVGSDEAEACDVESGEYGMWDEVILSKEELKKKLVYFITTPYEHPFDLKLKMFNPHDAAAGSSTPGLIDKTYLFQKNLPTGFDEIIYQEIAALESKLYFIGGLYPDDTMSNKVFAFDTASEAWDTAIADTKQTRFGSTVLTFQDKIYVFGCDTYYLKREDPRAPQHWAEFYDPKTNKWDYLPDTPPEALMLGYSSTVHVLMEELKIVLFCVDGMDFYGYSFEEGSWFHAPPSSTQELPIYLGENWGPNIVVVNSSWFCVSGQSIYRYDLKSDTKAAAPICTIKQSLQSGLRATPVCDIQHAALPGHFSQSFFFVYAGNGKFCLAHCSGTFTVCQTFGLHSSRFSKQSGLRYENFVTCGADERMYAVVAM